MSFSQNTTSVRENYTWKETIKPFELMDKYQQEDQVIVFEKKFNEIVSVEGNLMMDSWLHCRIYLNSDKAIEDNNKLYIPMSDDGKLFEHNLRLIYPDGRVRVIDVDQILEGVHTESQTRYSYYALEELEKGVEIEYLYKTRGSAYFFGYVNYIEDDCPLHSYYWEMVIPNYLRFSFNSYNGLKNVEIEEVDDTRYRAKIRVVNVEKFKREPLAYGKSNKQYFLYRLDEHQSIGRKNINSFGSVSESLHEQIKVPDDRRLLRNLTKEFENINIKPSDDDRERAIKVEHYIKTNYAYIEKKNKNLRYLGDILKSRSFDQFGALGFYHFMFDMAGLEPQVVSTCDRGRFKFDPDFECHLFLEKIFLRLRNLDLFVDPSDQMSRLSTMNPMFLGHKGLIIDQIKIQNSTTPIAKIETFTPTKSKDNLIETNINVFIEDEFDNVNIKVDKKLHGLNAKTFQGLFDFVQEDKMDEYYKYILQFYGEHAQLADCKFYNLGGEYIARKPVHFELNMAGDPFLEYAGNKIIFKVGSLIGPQSQLYQEDGDSRKYDVGGIEPRRYEYEINIEIPEGYEVVGMEDLSIERDEKDDEYDVYFVSRYEIIDDQISITIEENYDHSEYPVSFFSTYREVINAAADFNKVKLVFNQK